MTWQFALRFLLCCLAISPCGAAWAQSGDGSIRLVVGHSSVIEMRFKIASIAVGNPAVARATPVSSTSILLNAVAPGTTSMLVFDKGDTVRNYRVIVSHDLSYLQTHLHLLDRRLRVDTDPNGDSVILSGIAANKAVAERAVEAAYRYFGTVTLGGSTNPRNSGRVTRGGRQTSPSDMPGAPQDGDTVAGAPGERSTLTETLSDGEIKVINLIITDEALVPAPMRLQTLLQQIDTAITVQEVNGVFVLRGQVASPAALGRAVALADRFVSTGGAVDIRVFTDRGGVLLGNSDPSIPVEPVSDDFVLPRGLGFATGQNRRGQNGTGVVIPTELSDYKGNLAQNLSRGDVLTAANGKVISLLTLREQPRVEIKMSIVAIDRTRTDKLGINWRLDGSRVSIDTTGATVGTPPNNILTVLPELAVGGVTAVGKFVTGFATVQSFVQALKQRGIAQSVSEPLLTALSGESSSFLVGGNVPIPVQTIIPATPTAGAIVAFNVEFIEFGLRVVVRPTVTESGRISVVLDQIITEPDRSAAVVVNGVSIPGFKQRSVRTLTESSDGETWAVAGLIADIDSTNKTAVPFLSKIPWLGALFRSESDEKTRSELILTVTARRVAYPEPSAPTLPAMSVPATKQNEEMR